MALRRTRQMGYGQKESNADKLLRNLSDKVVDTNAQDVREYRYEQKRKEMASKSNGAREIHRRSRRMG